MLRVQANRQQQAGANLTMMQCGYARVMAEDRDGLFVVRVSGVVTKETAAAIIGDMRGLAHQPLAQVVSYEAAVVCMTTDEMLSTAALARQRSVPTAFVVSEAQRSIFSEYARMNADLGILKVAFTGHEQAHRWAGDQARVQDYWGRVERGLRSSP